MSIRTDLAAESDALCSDSLPNGVTREVTQQDGVCVTKIHITSQEGAKAIGRPCGNYITLETERLLSPQNLSQESELLKEELSHLIPENGSVLVIGLGNEEITPDAIGPLAADEILATRHFKGELADSLGLSSLRPVSVLAPGVLGQTGLEASEVIVALKEKINPDAVIAIDALAARSINRLGNTIQICDTGISPGSGVQNHRRELSFRTLGVPVIAIGIPTVIDMSTLLEDFCSGAIVPPDRPMMVTPRDIDRVAAKSARLIATGLNLALQSKLSAEDLIALTE